MGQKYGWILRSGCLLSSLVCLAGSARAQESQPFRPPAVPLVTSDPYLSIWSEADHLSDKNTRHWTGREHSLLSMIRIDGKAFRLMGEDPSEVGALPQVGLKVWPTRTIYDFQGQNVHVTLTFMTPALPDDLDVMARPVTYINWDVRSTDGNAHSVQVFYSTSSQLTVNKPEQPVTWSRETDGALTALKIGTAEQRLFSTPADDVRIDWGYAYTAAATDQSTSAIGGAAELLLAFTEQGKLPEQDDTKMPRPVKDDQPITAFEFDLGQVKADAQSRHVMVAYDEIYAVKFFGKNLRPYWSRKNEKAGDLLLAAEKDYQSLIPRCQKFDTELVNDAKKVGGDDYGIICALAYRQCWAGCGIAADAHGQPLLFTKENTSNGDIATVDVIFPMDPIWVLLSPTLAKASLVPDFAYAASSHWKFPNAPHDLGIYPVARGTDDGGEGMPVEESGNMIILADAIAQEDGNADFVKPWWPQITQWAQYLEQYGLDPEEQLCTDDFMGHLAHNSNLSVKAIVALGAYGDLCRIRGDAAGAENYMKIARTDAQHWLKAAADADHYNLAFDKPHTWSQKYNLVWDKILGLNLFPAEVYRKEIKLYKSKLNPYGVPLDSRTKLTKSDWSLWTATLADNDADFKQLIAPIVKYLNQTTARSPFADSFETNNIHSDGMHARPVIGGVFVRMLADKEIWKKWAARDVAKPTDWAKLPLPPKVTEIVPTSQLAAVKWQYTTDKPADDWSSTSFDDSNWKSGDGGFGAQGTPGSVVRTRWDSDDIWLRRQFVMPDTDVQNLQVLVDHDEDVEVYINGVLAVSESGFSNGYVSVPVSETAKAQLKAGATISLAVHCHQTVGGQAVDVGLANVVEQE